jgi:proline dehydrogenase
VNVLPGFAERAIARTLPYAPRGLVGRVARRYIAGDTIADALATVKELAAEGVRATVAVLGEDVHAEAEARAIAAEYLELIDRLAGVGAGANVSLKLTSLGLGLSDELLQELLGAVLDRAAAHEMFVRIDMEDATTTDATLATWRACRDAGRRDVGVVLQAMLRRTVADARALAAEGAPVRVCKGIYREPAEIAFQDPGAVRAAYLETVRALVAGSSPIALATHDDVLASGAWQIVDEAGAADRTEHQMLLGVRERMRSDLVRAGRPVRVYVPYGPRWYEYSLRRLQENPKIAGHVAKATLGLG